MTPPDQDRIPVGYVRKAHGIDGDVLIRGTVQDAEERFVVGAQHITDEKKQRELTVEKVRAHQGDYIVSFEGVNGRDAAENLRGVQLVIDKSERRILDEGEWWPEQVVGCAVVAVDGSSLGSVKDVITGSSQDRLVVVSEEGERAEIPFVSALVPTVDVVGRRIVVDLPDGLFE